MKTCEGTRCHFRLGIGTFVIKILISVLWYKKNSSAPRVLMIIIHRRTIKCYFKQFTQISVVSINIAQILKKYQNWLNHF